MIERSFLGLLRLRICIGLECSCCLPGRGHRGRFWWGPLGGHSFPCKNRSPPSCCMIVSRWMRGVGRTVSGQLQSCLSRQPLEWWRRCRKKWSGPATEWIPRGASSCEVWPVARGAPTQKFFRPVCKCWKFPPGRGLRAGGRRTVSHVSSNFIDVFDHFDECFMV